MTKNITILVILVANFCSCIKERSLETDTPKTEPSTVSAKEKWQLVKMTGSMVNSETTGAAMAWQEYYILNPDRTFLKSREASGTKDEASGTYKFVTLSGQQYLELAYAQHKHPLIGNCTGEDKEYLLIQSENKMSGTWNICDGPGLEYEKVK